MKKIIFPLSAIIIIAGAFILFSFNSGKTKQNPFTTATYYYKTGICNRRIAPGIIDEDCCRSSLDATTFKDTSNWTATPNTSFTDDNFIAAITFDKGTGYGEITLQQALNCVWDYYVSQSPHALPADNASITCYGVSIIIRRKGDC
jgi:hypothetical protein